MSESSGGQCGEGGLKTKITLNPSAPIRTSADNKFVIIFIIFSALNKAQ